MSPAPPHRFRSLLAASFLTAALALGCASSPSTRLYVLSAVAEPDAAVAAGGVGELLVGVGPIEVPPYLERPQIVARDSDHQLRLGDFDRWGEPLADGFARVLAEDLGRLLGTQQIFVYPWREPASIDLRLAVTVRRFEEVPGGDCLLEAAWAVYGRDHRTPLRVATTTHRAPIGGVGYDAVVAALSRTVADLAREVAGGLAAAADAASSPPPPEADAPPSAG